MKHGGSSAICLVVGLVLQTNGSALATEGNPYTAIVKQNVFRLTAALPVKRVVPEVTLPKITLLGIVSGYGPKQVMFKILTGTPPRESNYALGEMEQADEIEVIEIMESAGMVRVKNHGQGQTLSLEKDGMRPGGISSTIAATAPPRSAHTAAARIAGPPQHQPPAMTAEEQVIRMEIDRKLTTGPVEKGLMPPLPPPPINVN